MAAIVAGKHVIVDKPLAVASKQSREHLRAANDAGVVHAVTFNSRFYPMVQQARALVQRGDIGKLRFLHGHYMQEWLQYDTDYSWRLEPEKSGPAAMVGDAGCHWFDLVEFVSGVHVRRVLADLQTVVKTRMRPRSGSRDAFSAGSNDDTEPYAVEVPDYGAVLLEFDGGAHGTFFTSPLCAIRMTSNWS